MARSTDDRSNRDSGPVDPHRPENQPRRRRRWPYYIGGFFVFMIIGLILLAILLPSLVSSSPGKNYALSFLNRQIRGELQVQDVDISWRGPLQVQGLTVLDPQRREVLSVNKAVLNNGLWHVVRSPMTFGQVDLYQPKTNIYMQHDQPPSLVQAFDRRQPAAAQPPGKQEQEAGKAPAPKGQLTIHSGNVRIVKPDGQKLDINDITGQLTIDTLDDVRGDLAAHLASGGSVQVKANVRNLVDDQEQIDLNNATGDFAVQTPEPLKIAPMAAFADQSGFHGQASLDLQGTLDRGTLLANLRTTVNQFYAVQQEQGEAPAAQPRPIDLALVGRVQAGRERVNADLNLTGDAGPASVKAVYVPSTQPANVDGEKLTATLLTGEPINLPNVSAEVQTDLNLQILAQALPRLLQVRQGVEIASGTLRIPNLAVRTEPQLAAQGSVQLTDLAAAQNGQTIEWQPVSLDINAHVEPNVGLQVEQGRLQSEFAQAQVQGNPADLQGQFQADLARLDRQLRQLVDLGNVRLAGGVQGRFRLARANENQIDLTSEVTASNLEYAAGDQRLNVQQATLNPSGTLLLWDNQLQRAVLNETHINVDRQVQLTTAGDYIFGPKSWRANLTVNRALLPYLVNLAQGLGVRALDQYEGYAGEIDNLAMTASWDPQAGAFASNGNGAIRNLGRGEQTVAHTLSLEWRQAAYAPNVDLASLQALSVQTDYFDLAATDVQLQLGENMRMQGKVDANAQVRPTLAAVYALAKMQEPPNLGGQLKFVSNCKTQGNTIGMTGDMTIRDFEVGAGEQTVRQDQVRFAYDAQVNNQNNTITIRRAELSSQPLSARIAGSIRDFRSQQLLEVNGQYTADWDQVMPVLYQFSPGMKDTVALRGRSRGQVAVTGPAYQPDVQPVFRGLKADGPSIGWESGLVYGLELGAAKIQPTLENGRLVLANTAIPASGGTINLAGMVDLTGKTPMFRLPGEVRMLDNIDLNTQIGRQLLSYANPLFADVAGIEGKVSLVVHDIDLPLGEQIKQSGTGRGQLNMRNVRVKPAGAFGVLVRIAGATQARGGQANDPGQAGLIQELGRATGLGGQPQPPLSQADPTGAVDIRIGSPTFEIRDGRIYYDNFTMAFPNGINMVFSGWVGFDDTVKMYVGVPVTAGLLQAAGVKGPVVQYASVLEGVRVDVPIVGSRTSSRLDFAQVKIQPLVEQAIRNLAAQGVREGVRTAVPGLRLIPGQQQPGSELPGEGIIRDILPGTKRDQPQQQDQAPPDQQQQKQQRQEEPKRGLPGEGILRDLLPGGK